MSQVIESTPAHGPSWGRRSERFFAWVLTLLLAAFAATAWIQAGYVREFGDEAPQWSTRVYEFTERTSDVVVLVGLPVLLSMSFARMDQDLRTSLLFWVFWSLGGLLLLGALTIFREPVAAQLNNYMDRLYLPPSSAEAANWHFGEMEDWPHFWKNGVYLISEGAQFLLIALTLTLFGYFPLIRLGRYIIWGLCASFAVLVIQYASLLLAGRVCFDYDTFYGSAVLDLLLFDLLGALFSLSAISGDSNLSSQLPAYPDLVHTVSSIAYAGFALCCAIPLTLCPLSRSRSNRAIDEACRGTCDATPTAKRETAE